MRSYRVVRPRNFFNRVDHVDARVQLYEIREKRYRERTGLAVAVDGIR